MKTRGLNVHMEGRWYKRQTEVQPPMVRVYKIGEFLVPNPKTPVVKVQFN